MRIDRSTVYTKFLDKAITLLELEFDPINDRSWEHWNSMCFIG
jgi:hypothetical protein